MACIPAMPMILTAIIVGEQLAIQYGIGTSICSILIGNLCLWIIGMVMISMSYQDRTNAIQNAKNYIGKYGGMLSAIILTIAFINWFVIVLNSTLITIDDLFHFGAFWENQLVRFGAGLGVLAALFSMGRVSILKWATSLACPLIIAYHMFAILSQKHTVMLNSEKWELSYSGIWITILVFLPGMINIPTIFRYSRSRAHSYLGLSLFVMFVSLFQISSIWMPFTQNLTVNYTGSYFQIFAIFTLVILLFKAVFANVLNIYLASASWETFLPRFEGNKGNAIMGMLSTAVYTLIQIASPSNFLRDLLNAYLAILGIVLLIAFIAQVIIKHRPRIQEKIVNALAWVFGCLAATICLIQTPENPIHSLLMGIGITLLFFALVIFFEETVWGIRKLFSEEWNKK
ncbi:MAG: hypothetical protein K1X28_05935 [Parachlamydiales bacterium]|nr:hypothetical protein [Parachlamydiales bacterium]